ncbi:MAG: MinD/ParA family protein [Phycisphaerales bacterium]|nr:MinD/ParA family protein [Phycisphaerales bacterium]
MADLDVEHSYFGYAHVDPRVSRRVDVQPHQVDQAEELRRLARDAAATQQRVEPQKQSRPPISIAAPAAAPQPIFAPTAVAPRTSVRLARAIAVSSGKGGVGKTNLAVNLAVAFAARGLRVALLDADLGLANADLLCGLTPKLTLEDLVRSGRSIEEIAMPAPGGFFLIPGASGVSLLADLTPTLRRHVVSELARLERSVDILLIDTGAGIGANSMAFAAAAHTILVATTPEPTSIADAYGAIKTLVARGSGEGIRLVVNMAQSEHEIRAVHERIDRVSRAFLQTPIRLAGGISYDPAVPAAVRRREPFLVASPRARASQQLHEIAAFLSGESSPSERTRVRESFLGRLSGWLARTR